MHQPHLPRWGTSGTPQSSRANTSQSHARADGATGRALLEVMTNGTPNLLAFGRGITCCHATLLCCGQGQTTGTWKPRANTNCNVLFSLKKTHRPCPVCHFARWIWPLRIWRELLYLVNLSAFKAHPIKTHHKIIVKLAFPRLLKQQHRTCLCSGE